MKKKDYEIAIAITKNMIDNANKMLAEYIEGERWGSANEQSSYLTGLRQALFNFGITYYKEKSND